MVIFTERHGAASAASIEALRNALGISNRAWIVDFWRKSDGALLNDQVLIYSVSDIEERNNTFEVEDSFKGMIAVGDDSGGRLILINKCGEGDFFLVDSGNTTLDGCDRFETIEKLLDYIEEDEGEGEVATAGLGDIFSKGSCKPSIEEVVDIKKMLGLNYSIVQLKAILAKSGQVVMKSVYAQKYQEALKRFSHVIEFR